MSWPTVALGELVEIKGGGTPDKSVASYWNGPIPWASVKDFKNVALSETSDTITREGVEKSATNIIPRGTVIVPTRMAVGKAAINTIDLAINQDLKALFPIGALNSRYLLHFMLASRERLQRSATGATVKGITLKVLKELKVPLPSLPEQQRIAAILDQADALRRLRRQSLSRLSDLGEAIFAEMFGSGSHTNHTALVPLSQVAQLINGDRSSNYPSGNDIVDAGVLFLSTRNILDGKVDLSFRQFITSEKFNSLGGGRLARDDVVITLRGTTGLSAVFNTEYETGFINAQLMIIRCGSSLLPQYLQRYLSLPATQHRMKKGGSGSAIPQLTGAQMKNFMILVPPIAQQRAFVDANADLQDHITDILASASKLDALFASLQQRAFRGEL